MNSININNLKNLKDISNRQEIKSKLDEIQINHKNVKIKVKNPLVHERNVRKILKHSVLIIIVSS